MSADPRQSTSPERSPDILESWKEIASYLGRSVRAVQLWERDEGLPVHRQLHEKQGTVYARRSELDSWLARPPRPRREAPAPR